MNTSKADLRNVILDIVFGRETVREADWLLVNEIFWDLVAERVLTPGMNSSNLKFPWFRLHSEAAANLVAAK